MYEYHQTVRYGIDKDAYEKDRTSGNPRLPAPCTGTDPPDPCAKTIWNGHYEIELQFSGLFNLAEIPSIHEHGTLVAETALKAATDLGPQADYLIRSLALSGGTDIFTLLEQERTTFDKLTFPQFSSPGDVVPVVQAIRPMLDTIADKYNHAQAWLSSMSERVVGGNFAFDTLSFPRFAEAGLKLFNHSAVPFEVKAYAFDYQLSVDRGSVHVWAAGNGFGGEPIYAATLPVEFPNLEPGWLAVAALGEDGDIAVYSSHCGVASAWCLAAPGTHLGVEGTSFSAPYVSGAIAALKAQFPNLSHQQIRARILVTADDNGKYADSAVYGQGRFDYSAASAPLGSLVLPLSQFANGPATPLSGTSLRLPRGLAARHFAGRNALALDSYQRAPFPIDLGSLVNDRLGPGMADFDAAIPVSVSNAPPVPGFPSATFASGQGHAAYASGGSGLRLGFGHGTGALDSLSAALAGPGLPGPGRYRLSADGLAAGLSLPDGPFGSRLVVRMAVEPSDAVRKSVEGQAPGRVFAGSLYSPGGESAFGMSFASDLAAPAGIFGAGAFAVSGDAVEIGYARRLTLDGPLSLTGHGRVSSIAFDDAPLVSADRAFVFGIGIEGSYNLGRRLALAARFAAEREFGGGQVSVHLPSSVDETGTLAFSPVRLPHRETLDRQQLSLFLCYRTPGVPGASWTVGGLVERNALGETASVVGMRGMFRF